MLDLKFVRENPEIVKQNIRNKFQDSKLPLVDEVIELDEENRATKKEADDLRADRNRISKQIGALMGQGKKEEAEEVKKQVTAASDHLAELEEKERDLRSQNPQNHDDDPQHHRPVRSHRKGRQRECGSAEVRRAGCPGF